MRDPNMTAKPDLPDPAEDEGVCTVLPLELLVPLPVDPLEPGARLTLLFKAPRAESAVEEELRDRLVATPLISFSVSSIGSLLTNSFCSNCTTT